MTFSDREKFDWATERGIPIHFLRPARELNPQERFPCGSLGHNEPSSSDACEVTCTGCHDLLARLGDARAEQPDALVAALEALADRWAQTACEERNPIEGPTERDATFQECHADLMEMLAAHRDRGQRDGGEAGEAYPTGLVWHVRSKEFPGTQTSVLGWGPAEWKVAVVGQFDLPGNFYFAGGCIDGDLITHWAHIPRGPLPPDDPEPRETADLGALDGDDHPLRAQVRQFAFSLFDYAGEDVSQMDILRCLVGDMVTEIARLSREVDALRSTRGAGEPGGVGG